jgi:hypothetical protein
MKYLLIILCLLLPSWAWGQCNMCPSGWTAWSTVLDSFDRADETPPPMTGWSGVLLLGESGITLYGNNAYTTDAAWRTAAWGGSTYGPNTEVFVDVVHNGSVVAVFARCSNVKQYTFSGYAGWHVSSNTARFYKTISGTNTQIGASFNCGSSGATTYSFGITVVGNTIDMYERINGGAWAAIAGASRATGSDLTGAGYVGLGFYNHAGNRADNFGGGTIP